MQKSIGVAKRILPPHIVPSQLKILMPVGTPTSMVEIAKKALPAGVMPTVNMWCAHTPRLMKPIAQRRRDHHRVAEDRLAREDRDDLGGEREGGMTRM